MPENVFLGPFPDGFRKFPEFSRYPVPYFITLWIFIIIDVCFIYILHKTGLRIPDPSNNNINLIENNDNNKPTQYDSKLKRFIFNHLLYPDYSGYYINNLHLLLSKNEVLSYWNRNESFIDIICRPNNPRLRILVYFDIVLRIYQLLCGLLFFCCVIIVCLGVAVDYVVIVSEFKAYYDLIILVWIIYIIFWISRKLFFGMYLLFYNICDKYNMWIVFYWRLIAVLINALAAGVVSEAAITQMSHPTPADRDYARWFSALMLIRGGVFIGLNVLASIGHSIVALYRIFTKNIDYSIRINIIIDVLDKIQSTQDSDTIANKAGEQYNPKELKWWMLLFNIDPRHKKCQRIVYIIYTSIVWVLIIVYMVTNMGLPHCNLMKWTLIMYYFVAILVRTRTDALFYFWSGIYHFRYHQLLVSFYENQPNIPRPMKPRM